MKKIAKKVLNKSGHTLAGLLAGTAAAAALAGAGIGVAGPYVEQANELADVTNLVRVYATAEAEAVSGIASGTWYFTKTEESGLTRFRADADRIGKGTAKDGGFDFSGIPAIIEDSYDTVKDYTDNIIKVTISGGNVKQIEFTE